MNPSNNFLTKDSLKSPIVKKIFKRMRDNETACVEKISANMHILCFDFDDFMEELCNVYDNGKLS
jgi:hypothetical protein